MCEDRWIIEDGMCIHADLFPIDTIDIVMGFLVFAINIFAAVAGIGGGSLYVPLFIMLGKFDTFYSIPLASITIAGNSLARVLFLRQHVDYMILLLLVPFSINTTFAGFVLNSYSPSVVVLGVLIVVLTAATAKTAHTGVVMYINRNEPLCDPAADIPLSSDWRPPVGILLIIFTIFASTVGLRSLLHTCSTEYWIFVVTQFVIIGAIGAGIAIFYRVRLRYTTKEILKYTGMASITGAVATYIGIGGGILLNPFLLYMGTEPKIMSATVSTFALFTSFSGALQYLFTDRILPEYSIYFGVIGFVSAIVGSLVLSRVSVKRGYVIVFTAAGLIATSCVLLIISKIISEENVVQKNFCINNG